MPSIDIELSRAQQNRLKKGLAIRISFKQLSGDGVPVNVTEAAAKRVASAARRGKGVQLKASDIADEEDDEDGEFEGGRIRIGRAFRNLGRDISRTTNRAVNAIDSGARRTLTAKNVKMASHKLGEAVEQGKKYVPKSAVKGAVTGLAYTAATASGNPWAGKYLDRALQPGVEATYATNLARGSVGKNWAKSYGQNLATQEAQLFAKGAKASAGAGFIPVGSGIIPVGTRGGRLAKGSEAAREHMAALRARRGTRKFMGMGISPVPLEGGPVSHVRDAAGNKRSNTRLRNLDAMSGDFVGRGFLPL